MSGSLSKTGCENTTGAGTSIEGSVADGLSAVCAMDGQTGNTLSASLVEAVFSTSVTVTASGGGVSPD